MNQIKLSQPQTSQNKRCIRNTIVGVILFAFIYSIAMLGVLAAAGMYFIAFSSKQHPTDHEMIEQFYNNRRTFERLALLFEGDIHMQDIDYVWTEPINGLDDQRWQQYIQLFQQLHLDSGISGNQERTAIDFQASSSGLGISGSAKGYAYRKIQPATEGIVANIDETLSADGVTRYRHIEGNWYIYGVGN